MPAECANGTYAVAHGRLLVSLRLLAPALYFCPPRTLMYHCAPPPSLPPAARPPAHLPLLFTSAACRYRNPVSDFVKPLAGKLVKKAAGAIFKKVADQSVGQYMKAAMKALGAALGAEIEAGKERNVGVALKITATSPEDESIRKGGWTFALSGYFRSEVGYTFSVSVPETLAITGEMWRGTEVRAAARVAACLSRPYLLVRLTYRIVLCRLSYIPSTFPVRLSFFLR